MRRLIVGRIISMILVSVTEGLVRPSSLDYELIANEAEARPAKPDFLFLLQDFDEHQTGFDEPLSTLIKHLLGTHFCKWQPPTQARQNSKILQI